jgi:hypothetical protein
MYAGVVISVCNQITADGKYFTNFHVQTARGYNIMCIWSQLDQICGVWNRIYHQQNVGKSQFCNIGHAIFTLFNKKYSQTILGMYTYWI